MFSIPRVNVIESDNGFSVQVLGRVGLCYREGDPCRSMRHPFVLGSPPTMGSP
jgi:hypothetical protein